MAIFGYFNHTMAKDNTTVEHAATALDSWFNYIFGRTTSFLMKKITILRSNLSLSQLNPDSYRPIARAEW